MELLNQLSTPRAKTLFFEKSLHRIGVETLLLFAPRIFTVGEIFQHDPAAVTIEVFHNGRRLTFSDSQSPDDGEYFVSESVVGNGFDRIELLFTPNSRSTLVSNYFAA